MPVRISDLALTDHLQQLALMSDENPVSIQVGLEDQSEFRIQHHVGKY